MTAQEACRARLHTEGRGLRTERLVSGSFSSVSLALAPLHSVERACRVPTGRQTCERLKGHAPPVGFAIRMRRGSILPCAPCRGTDAKRRSAP
jgi:hypothetical protein